MSFLLSHLCTPSRGRAVDVGLRLYQSLEAFTRIPERLFEAFKWLSYALIQRFFPTVLVQENDPLYRQISDWVERQSGKQIRLEATTRSRPGQNIIQYTSSHQLTPSHFFWKDGHCFTIRFSSESEEVTIAVLGFSVNPIKALLQQITAEKSTEAKDITVYQPVVYPNNRVGWSSRKCRGREIKSIFQSSELRHDLLTDVYCFLHERSEKMYERRGIPYRRGYLFSGPPGTGKTSMIIALANEFNLPIYRIPLGQMNDGIFAALIQVVPKWAIVVIEDIDCAGLENRSEKGTNLDPNRKPKIALSTLLNAMDGMEAGIGRILIVTTNFPERLDPAITREGRIHLTVRFDFITSEQAREMFGNFYSQVKGEDNDTQDKNVDEVYKSFGFNPPDVWALMHHQEWIGDLKALSMEFSKLVPKGWRHAKVEELLIRNPDDPRMAIKQLRQEGSVSEIEQQPGQEGSVSD